MSILKNLRQFASGELNESALNESMLHDNDDISDILNDKEFMSECVADCIPTILQMEILGESAELMDEATKDAFYKVQDYYIGQGIMSEAAKVHIGNPKINVVHLNPKAMIARLTAIITIKLARKDNNKSYKKYKLGQRIKKENYLDMKKRYGAKAERIAKKVYQQSKRAGKTSAVVEEKRKEIKSKTK